MVFPERFFLVFFFVVDRKKKNIHQAPTHWLKPAPVTSVFPKKKHYRINPKEIMLLSSLSKSSLTNTKSFFFLRHNYTHVVEAAPAVKMMSWFHKSPTNINSPCRQPQQHHQQQQQRRNYTVPIVLESGNLGERSFDIFSRLLRERIICVHGQVTDTMASLVTAQLLFLEAENPNKPVYMYINSPGGVVTAGMAMYDTMQYIRPKVSYCILCVLLTLLNLPTYLLSCPLLCAHQNLSTTIDSFGCCFCFYCWKFSRPM